MLLIDYNQANIYRCGELYLIPGINEVKEEIWKEVADHPLVKKRIETGQITILKPEQSQSDSQESDTSSVPPANPFTGLNFKEAKEIIAQTYDLLTLEKWMKTEDRKNILKLLEEQIESLKVQKTENPKKD